jgi:putative ABC transport system permease protein
MFGYYLDLALRSLRRNPALTGLMVLAIAFGVGASMTTYSVFRAVSGDPIPWKSSKLYVPQIDLFGPAAPKANHEPQDLMSYRDAMAVTHAHRARFQSAMYNIAPSIDPVSAGSRPREVMGHAVQWEFFPMVDAPFSFGHAWSADDDTARARVVVISSRLNDRMFKGVDSTNKEINLDGRPYRIVGVLDHFTPEPLFYDVSNRTFGDPDDVFVPLETAIALQSTNTGNFNCAHSPVEEGFAGTLVSECAWLALMVQLDSPDDARAYRQWLDGYTDSQRQAGRFSWVSNNRLRNLPQWLDFNQVAPPDTKVSLLVALGLLVVCMVNTIGLMLAKFLRRSGEIGVRRALGASRLQIGVQFTVEAAVLGLTGGVLGLVLTWAGMQAMRAVLPKEIAALATMDGPLLSLTLCMAVLATVVAGLYPTLRATWVRPALQLKSN